MKLPLWGTNKISNLLLVMGIRLDSLFPFSAKSVVKNIHFPAKATGDSLLNDNATFYLRHNGLLSLALCNTVLHLFLSVQGCM